MWGSVNYKYIQKAAVGRSGGMALIWDPNMFQVDQAVEGNYFLAIKGKLKGLSNDLIVVNVYGPHEDEKKRNFLESLDNLMKFNNDDWILCGNFNEDLSVRVLDRKFSDHCPLLLRSKIIDYGPKPIKVFNSWINDKGAEEIVTSAWNVETNSCRPDINFRLKLKNVKLALKEWSKEKFGKLDVEIEKAKLEANAWEKIADSRELNETKRGI
ncbi:uncharacterized protein [Rutidosis leptorrhynchoides]|uniref:uncharacterized protein n=1 Tax=Rutidosis leptorrhynchoides TaxID=125765 RepID=UPI003A99CD49